MTVYSTGDITRPYHLRLFDSLVQLKDNNIINDESFEQGKQKIIERYGPLI